MTLVQIDKKAHFALDNAVVKRFNRLQQDYNWVFSHKKELTKQFPDMYIAVENETVRFACATVNELMSKIAQNNEQVDNFAIEYLDQHPRSFLF